MITREEARVTVSMVPTYQYALGYNDAVETLFDKFEQHIKSLEAQLANTEQLTCEYKEDHDVYMGTVYNFSCGYSYVTIEGDLKENGVKYCPSCGGIAKLKDTQ